MSDLAEKFRLSPDQSALDLLLDEHVEASETLHRGTTLGVKSGNRSWGLDMPATWTQDHGWLAELLPDYHDYCRAVAVVRAKVAAREQGLTWTTVGYKNDYWHLAQWYLVCRRVRVPIYELDKSGAIRRNRAGKPIQKIQGKDKQPQWERQVRRLGEPPKVLAGVQWLERSWRERFRRGPRHVAWDKLLEPAA